MKTEFKEKWQLDEKGRCPHEHTYEDRIFLGHISKELRGKDSACGYEVYQCPDCGYIYMGVGIPLAFFLEDRTDRNRVATLR